MHTQTNTITLKKTKLHTTITTTWLFMACHGFEQKATNLQSEIAQQGLINSSKAGSAETLNELNQNPLILSLSFSKGVFKTPILGFFSFEVNSYELLGVEIGCFGKDKSSFKQRIAFAEKFA
jgi:hypothetical protein